MRSKKRNIEGLLKSIAFSLLLTNFFTPIFSHLQIVQESILSSHNVIYQI